LFVENSAKSYYYFTHSISKMAIFAKNWHFSWQKSPVVALFSKGIFAPFLEQKYNIIITYSKNRIYSKGEQNVSNKEVKLRQGSCNVQRLHCK
ncbi:MAG: hypothetical protein IJY13_00555, partial [Clostridia bacterium]|nr:hypothetical protein [Clostridia bacterium]